MLRKSKGAERPVIASVGPAPTLPEQLKPHAPKSAAPPFDRITGLHVSAHLMTLETGLFCLFPSPGSTPPDPTTGLPGIRITPAPTRPGQPDTVTISTFRKDGWLDSTAALVRISDGPGQLLITIYQHALQKPEVAPRVEVLRLSGQSNAAGPMPNRQSLRPPASESPAKSKPEVIAHLQGRGDVGGAIGEWMGNKRSQQWIEGFGIAPANGIALEDVEYQAVLGRDWLSPWVQGGKYCGSRGMALPLLGFKLRLKGAAAKAFECAYSASFVDGTNVGPIAAGATCVAPSLAALEAFQIVFKPIAATAASTKRAVPKRTAVSSPVAASSKRAGRR